MEKITKILGLLVVSVILTGCGKYDMVCTNDMNENGMKAKAKVEINFDGDKVKEAVATMDFDSKETATQMCSSLEMFKTDGVEIKCKDKKITINGYQLIDSESSSTKVEIKKSLEGDGFKCK